MQTSYQWDFETWSTNTDETECLDHDHRDKLSQFSDNSHIPDEPNTEMKLCLVRDRHGFRSWAYVENGKLPERFADAYGANATKVPKRFHNELAAWLAKHNQQAQDFINELEAICMAD